MLWKYLRYKLHILLVTPCRYRYNTGSKPHTLHYIVAEIISAGSREDMSNMHINWTARVYWGEGGGIYDMGLIPYINWTKKMLYVYLAPRGKF